MAIRFDASGDRLARTSGLLDFNSPYTCAGWFYIAADRNDFSTFLSFNRNDSANLLNEDWLGVGANGVQLQLFASNASSAPASADGSDLSLATWYHLAMVRVSATSLLCYVNGVQTLNNTTDIAGRLAATRQEIASAYTSSPLWLNGRAAHVKVWNAALTADEIVAEMYSFAPQRLANLWSWLPMIDTGTNRSSEWSGSGNTWTANGTLADEDGPAVVANNLPFWSVPWVVAAAAASIMPAAFGRELHARSHANLRR